MLRGNFEKPVYFQIYLKYIITNNVLSNNLLDNLNSHIKIKLYCYLNRITHINLRAKQERERIYVDLVSRRRLSIIV